MGVFFPSKKKKIGPEKSQPKGDKKGENDKNEKISITKVPKNKTNPEIKNNFMIVESEVEKSKKEEKENNVIAPSPMNKLKALDQEEMAIIQRQTDKIYEDLENVIEIFAECLSYKKSEFNEEILANAKEKLEMKIDNSGYLYMALLKEAKKDRKHSEILLENLTKQKNVVLEKFKQLEEIISFFGLQEEYRNFEAILKDESYKPYEFKPMTFKDCSEDQLENVSVAINQIISKFSEIQNKKQQQIQQGKLPNEKEHQEIVDAQITGFQYKISHAPENDVLFLVNNLSLDNNAKLLKKMIQENYVNPKQVDGLINLLRSFSPSKNVNKKDIDEFIQLFQEYKSKGNILL